MRDEVVDEHEIVDSVTGLCDAMKYGSGLPSSRRSHGRVKVSDPDSVEGSKLRVTAELSGSERNVLLQEPGTNTFDDLDHLRARV